MEIKLDNHDVAKMQNPICLHCGDVCFSSYFLDSDKSFEKPFCCLGCKTVYQVINSTGLNEFYQIKNNGSSIRKQQNAKITNSSFEYLNSKDYLEKYIVKNDEAIELDFYLEGVHCLACLWLIEKVPYFVDDAISVKLNLETSVASVVMKKTGRFSEVASWFNQFGYAPHPITASTEARKLKKKEFNSMLIKLGVAATSAGNIMFLAISLYAGAEYEIIQQFQWISMFLALPVLFYSATPFYKKAWSSIKMKSSSIDLPISFAIISAGLISCINVIRGMGEVYFDSVVTLVTLLLFSRIFLKKVQQIGLDGNQNAEFFGNNVVNKVLVDNQVIETHLSEINIGDILSVKNGQRIPVDGELISKQTFINNSILSGESFPIEVVLGENVYSGGVVQGFDAKIKVLKLNSDTKLGKIVEKYKAVTNKTELLLLVDKLSKYFLQTILILSALTLAVSWYFLGLEVAINRTLALIIITCPCALGIATPLTFANLLNKAAKAGILIKSESVFEKLSSVKNIFFDKTGTLTKGKFQIVKWSNDDPSLREILFALEDFSQHPIASSLRSSAKYKPSSLDFSHIKENQGIGVEGILEDDHFEVKTIDKSFVDNETISEVALFKNKIHVLSVYLKDVIRNDSKKILCQLMSHYDCHLISGDSKDITTEVAKLLNIPITNTYSELSPEDKQVLIKNKNALMVGDGANDILAMKDSLVGVAVSGSVETSLKAADVYLLNPGIESIDRLIKLSKEGLYLIKRNLMFSLSYNVVGMVLAMMGVVGPLFAAVLMPLSSLTVVISILIGTKYLRNFNKEIQWK